MATVTSTRQALPRFAIVFATLSATGLLTAHGTTQLVASTLLDVPVDVGPAPAPPAGAVTQHVRDGHPLLAHQIFDSHLENPMEWDVPVAAVEPGEEVGDEAPPPPQTEWHEGDPQPPPCDGSIRLVASYVRRGVPEQSFAAITGSTGSSLLYRSGMTVDERNVVAIQPGFVVLRPSSGQLCSIGLFGDAPAVATTRVATAPPVAAPPDPGGGDAALGITAAEMEQNIQQISETSYSINRTLVDRLLANQAALMSAARVIPHEEDGHVVGVKIYGIRRSSLLGHLGIQNGDMLRTLNGYDLTDPTAVLDAYSRLRTADSLSVSIERRGAPVTVDYAIH